MGNRLKTRIYTTIMFNFRGRVEVGNRMKQLCLPIEYCTKELSAEGSLYHIVSLFCYNNNTHSYVFQIIIIESAVPLPHPIPNIKV